MADKVIIVGVRRGHERVSAIVLKQMAGRVGRSQYGPSGVVDILVGASEIDAVEAELDSVESFEVKSVFDDIGELAFHLVSEVSSGNVNTIKAAQEWYSRSYHHFCGGMIVIQEVVDYLIEIEAVKIVGDRILPTSLGNVSSRYYFRPEDVFGWRNNFAEIFDRGIENDDLAIAWSLSSVPCGYKLLDLGKKRNLMSIYREQVESFGLEILTGTSVTGLLWWNSIGGPPIAFLRGDIANLRKDFGRIYHALIDLDRISDWGMADFFDSLKVRVEHRIPNELVSLCKLPGIGKTFAYELYNMGIEDAEQLTTKMSVIQSCGNERLVNAVRKAIIEINVSRASS